MVARCNQMVTLQIRGYPGAFQNEALEFNFLLNFIPIYFLPLEYQCLSFIEKFQKFMILFRF